MHLTVRAKDLARILSTVRPAVATRSTMPILSMVLIEAREGALTASGCTLDTWAMDHTPAEIHAAGARAFPADALTAIVRSLPGEAEVTLRESDDRSGRVALAAGRTRVNLATLPHDDFPSFDRATSFSGALPADVARRLLVDTQFANAVDDSRYYMRGVHLRPVGGRLQASASDGHRAFRVTAELPPGLAAMPAITVPRDAQSPIAKILDGADGEVALSVSESRIVLGVGSRVFASKLVDGVYPDLDRVLPPMARTHSADVDREDLAAALRRVLAINEDKAPLVALAFAEGELRLRARGQSNDSADAVDAEVTGAAIEIGINGKYLLEHLAVMSGTTVALENETAGDPWRLIDEDGADVHVIMPVRVSI